MAQVKTIKFDKDEQPRRILLELSLSEAAYLAKLTGTISHRDGMEKYGQVFHPANTEVYGALTGIFNAYYEDGVDEALNGL